MSSEQSERIRLERSDAPTAADDRVWTDRIRASDTSAFEALYRTYWQRLYTFAFHYVHSKEEAEEIVQEVFFRIWRRRADWLPAGALASYLYLAVRNTALDRLERASVARRWRRRQVQEPEVGLQAHVEASDVAAAVERALAAIPQKRSAVCKLRLIEGLSYAQIADRLGICEKTVETQLARGLKFLRDQLRQSF